MALPTGSESTPGNLSPTRKAGFLLLPSTETIAIFGYFVFIIWIIVRGSGLYIVGFISLDVLTQHTMNMPIHGSLIKAKNLLESPITRHRYIEGTSRSIAYYVDNPYQRIVQDSVHKTVGASDLNTLSHLSDKFNWNDPASSSYIGTVRKRNTGEWQQLASTAERISEQLSKQKATMLHGSADEIMRDKLPRMSDILVANESYLSTKKSTSFELIFDVSRILPEIGTIFTHAEYDETKGTIYLGSLFGNQKIIWSDPQHVYLDGPYTPWTKLENGSERTLEELQFFYGPRAFIDLLSDATFFGEDEWNGRDVLVYKTQSVEALPTAITQHFGNGEILGLNAYLFLDKKTYLVQGGSLEIEAGNDDAIYFFPGLFSLSYDQSIEDVEPPVKFKELK